MWTETEAFLSVKFYWLVFKLDIELFVCDVEIKYLYMI